jgi:hypothetical protein
VVPAGKIPPSNCAYQTSAARKEAWLGDSCSSVSELPQRSRFASNHPLNRPAQLIWPFRTGGLLPGFLKSLSFLLHLRRQVGNGILSEAVQALV